MIVEIDTWTRPRDNPSDLNQASQNHAMTIHLGLDPRNRRVPGRMFFDVFPCPICWEVVTLSLGNAGFS